MLSGHAARACCVVLHVRPETFRKLYRELVPQALQGEARPWLWWESFALLSFEPGYVGSWWKEEGFGSQVGLSHMEDLAPEEMDDAAGAGLHVTVSMRERSMGAQYRNDGPGGQILGLTRRGATIQTESPACTFVRRETGLCIKNSGFKIQYQMVSFIMLIREAGKELLLESSAASARLGDEGCVCMRMQGFAHWGGRCLLAPCSAHRQPC